MMPFHNKRKEVTKTQWGMAVMRNPCDWAFLFISYNIFSKALLGEQLAVWEESCQRGSQNIWEVFDLGLVFLKPFCSEPLWPTQVSATPFSSFLSFSTQPSHFYTWPLWSQWSLGRVFSMASQFITICLCRTIYLSLPPSVPSFAFISFLITSLVGGKGRVYYIDLLSRSEKGYS